MKAGVDFVVDEEGEDTKEIGTGGIGMKAGVDFVVDEEVEDTEVVETMTGEGSGVTVSEPKPTGKLGTSHNNAILNMFLEKTILSTGVSLTDCMPLPTY